MHNTGRAIAVLEKINTYSWGAMLVVEEAIEVKKGIEHYCSCILDDQKDHSEGWIEIGKPEFMKFVTRKKKIEVVK